MILVEWGDYKTVNEPSPIDTRKMKGVRLSFGEENASFSITRQVFVDEANGGFDGNAIAMCIALAFDAVDLGCSNHWIGSPNEVATVRSTLEADKSVSLIWTKPATRISVHIDRVG